MNTRHSRATRFILRSIKTRVKRNHAPHGGTWQKWESWTADQRRHFLKNWTKLSPEQVDHFYSVAWFALSLHVRKSVKRFFEKEPVLDLTLGEMRYSQEGETTAKQPWVPVLVGEPWGYN
jgi:hypothetical protein